MIGFGFVTNLVILMVFGTFGQFLLEIHNQNRANSVVVIAWFFVQSCKLQRLNEKCVKKRRFLYFINGKSFSPSPQLSFVQWKMESEKQEFSLKFYTNLP